MRTAQSLLLHMPQRRGAELRTWIALPYFASHQIMKRDQVADGRFSTQTKGICECTEKAIDDSRQAVVFQFGG
jgi:hypothetical protein